MIHIARTMLVMTVVALGTLFMTPHSAQAGGYSTMYDQAGNRCWGGPDWSNPEGNASVLSCVVLVVPSNATLQLSWTDAQLGTAGNGQTIGWWSNNSSTTFSVTYSNGSSCSGKSFQAMPGTATVSVSSYGGSQIHQGVVNGAQPDCSPYGSSVLPTPPPAPASRIDLFGPGYTVYGGTVWINKTIFCQGCIFTASAYGYVINGNVVAPSPTPVSYTRFRFTANTPVMGGWIYYDNGSYVGYSCFVIATRSGWVDGGSVWPQFYPGVNIRVCGGTNSD